jgi:hypothetical protein
MLTLNMQKIISIVNSGYNIGAGKRKRMREGEEERGEWGGGGGGGSGKFGGRSDDSRV